MIFNEISQITGGIHPWTQKATYKKQRYQGYKKFKQVCKE